MKTLRNSKGFTLIELIIIIIILGILSAVAIPKYIDMKNEASKAAAKGIVGALAGADNILFANMLVKGTDYTNADIVSNTSISGGTVTMPDGTDSGTGTVTLTDGNSHTFTYTAHSSTSAGRFVVD